MKGLFLNRFTLTYQINGKGKIMAEYIFIPAQTVGINNPILFENSIGCNKGYVLHNNGDGTFILRGATPNCFARYQLIWNGNVQIPTGGEVTPVGIAISVNGETRPSSLAIATPQAVEEFQNLTSTAIITVPKGCCFNVSVRYVSGVTDGTTTPTPTVEVANANLTVSRIA